MFAEYDRSKFSRVYIKPPPKPEGFDRAVIDLCGYAHSHVPRCRVVWGQDVTTFRNGNPKAVKYPRPFPVGPDRWIIEAWRPPEFFGTERDWNAVRYADTDYGRIDRIGPFPRKGMYVFVLPVCKPDGTYLPCDKGVLDFIELKVAEFQHQTWNVYQNPQSYAELQEKMAEEEEAEMAVADAQADEFAEYVYMHEDEINRNPAFKFPTNYKKPVTSIWTPDGEHIV